MYRILPFSVSTFSGQAHSQAGAYFITLCTYNQSHLFGDIIEGEMKLNDLGVIVREEWEKTAEIRKEIELDEYVIMPNHFHAIVHIANAQTSDPAQTAAGPRANRSGQWSQDSKPA